ncbi:hypothetical protein KN1_23450 [Stygiolobus caldivivus]|uniref:Uncharacterized protein n=1 Tax=Stygiolobus caldivivus TaxID=2824673 RepID=A0A8D5U8W7_9CREN|nr:hypothetical protein KN1_23450 [Stygiolobus caldivivus]
MCSDKPWQYGIRSPNPSHVTQKIYNFFIIARTPLSLPEDLQCPIDIWTSISSKGYFYQTSLGYHQGLKQYVSAGSTSPQFGGHDDLQ